MNTGLVISLCLAWQSPVPQIDCLRAHEAVLVKQEAHTTDPVASRKLLAEYRQLDEAIGRITRETLTAEAP